MKFTWDPKNKDETDFAEKIFRHAIEKGDQGGYKATAEAKGKMGNKRQLKSFDPKAGEIDLTFF